VEQETQKQGIRIESFKADLGKIVKQEALTFRTSAK
jgi:hypothetical protein